MHSCSFMKRTEAVLFIAPAHAHPTRVDVYTALFALGSRCMLYVLHAVAHRHERVRSASTIFVVPIFSSVSVMTFLRDLFLPFLRRSEMLFFSLFLKPFRKFEKIARLFQPRFFLQIMSIHGKMERKQDFFSSPSVSRSCRYIVCTSDC